MISLPVVMFPIYAHQEQLSRWKCLVISHRGKNKDNAGSYERNRETLTTKIPYTVKITKRAVINVAEITSAVSAIRTNASQGLEKRVFRIEKCIFLFHYGTD